jgi:hypothetical protein
MPVHWEDETVKIRVLTTVAALAVVSGLLVGCSDDNNSELNRVVCEVEAVNGGVPLISAYVVDGGDGVIGVPPGGGDVDDVYTQDAVMMEFRARPYSLSTMTIPENDVYSSFIITGYNLTWVPGANAPAGLDMSLYNMVNAPFYLQVPVNDDAESAVLVATRELKEAIYAAQGSAPWPFANDFTAAAHLEFIGHDSGSQHEVAVPAGVLVSFTFAVSQD